MAQLVLGAAGAYVGYLIGGPTGAQYGFAAGSALGGYYETVNKKFEGPKLNDLRVTGTEYGEPIPYVIGAPRVSGQIWWASEKRAVANTTGGKGGEPEVTNYTYGIDILIGLSSNEIIGLGRIWWNGKLVYNGSDRTDLWRRMTVYTGEASQDPDPTYEAAVGVGNAPAYRGRGSVFFEGLQLDSGGNIPNLTFELNVSVQYKLWLRFEDSVSPLVDSSPFVRVFAGAAGYTYNSANVAVGAGALRISGGGYVYYDADAELDLGGYNFHIRGRFRLDPGSGRRFLCGQADASGSDASVSIALYRTAAGGLGIWVGDNAGGVLVAESVGGLIADNTYYELGIRRIGSTIEGLIDNLSVCSLTHSGNITTSGNSFTVGRLGAYTSEGLANGYVDEFIYERADSASLSAPVDVTLQEAVEDLCSRAGMSSGDYDASALASITQPVRAIAIAQIEPMRGTLDQLRQAYLFDAYLTDKLYFVPRGGSVSRTLTYAEIGAGFDSAEEDPLQVTVANDLELPPQVAVQYRNVSNDYQVGTEYSDRLISGQVAAAVVQLGLGLTPAEAKKAADTIVIDAHAGLVSAPFSVTTKHTELVPTDVVQVTDANGKLLRLRITRRRDDGGVIAFEGVRDDAGAVTSEALTDDGYTAQDTVTVMSETAIEPMDIPLLQDADDSPGWYVAARGTSSKWAGAVIQNSVNDVDFTEVARVAESAVLGTCTTTLGSGSTAVIDEVNTVTVSVAHGELASSTRDAMLADETINVMLIGSEVIRFVTATASSTNPNVYVLKRLFRGQLGTEWAVGSHGSNERCVLLRPRGLRRVTTTAAEIGAARYVRGVSLGLAVSSAASEPFTNTGVSQMPWSPVNLRQSLSGSDYTITWDRRSRLGARFASSAGISVPLGEASEAYEVDLFNGSTLVDTFSSTSPTVTFSGSYSGYTVVVYQLSEAVGRGYASASLTLI